MTRRIDGPRGEPYTLLNELELSSMALSFRIIVLIRPVRGDVVAVGPITP